MLVTPFVGVWIETTGTSQPFLADTLSHPSWVCGLKHYRQQYNAQQKRVTPFVGVWIET